MKANELIEQYKDGYRNFKGVDLRGADLRGAELRCVNLMGADLRGANLNGVNFGVANLNGAYLMGASLWYADLRGANLRWTILDPNIILPHIPDGVLTENGLIIDGDFVIGYRTKYGTVTDSDYEPGKAYSAPWFSSDTKTQCHPGIYIASIRWLRIHTGINSKKVMIACRRCDLLKAGNKFRARRILVLEDIR